MDMGGSAQAFKAATKKAPEGAFSNLPFKP